MWKKLNYKDQIVSLWHRKCGKKGYWQTTGKHSTKNIKKAVKYQKWTLFYCLLWNWSHSGKYIIQFCFLLLTTATEKRFLSKKMQWPKTHLGKKKKCNSAGAWLNKSHWLNELRLNPKQPLRNCQSQHFYFIFFANCCSFNRTRNSKVALHHGHQWRLVGTLPLLLGVMERPIWNFVCIHLNKYTLSAECNYEFKQVCACIQAVRMKCVRQNKTHRWRRWSQWQRWSLSGF